MPHKVAFKSAGKAQVSTLVNVFSKYKKKYAKSIPPIIGTILIFKLFPEEGAFGIHERPIYWSWTILWYSLVPIIGGILFAYLPKMNPAFVMSSHQSNFISEPIYHPRSKNSGGSFWPNTSASS